MLGWFRRQRIWTSWSASDSPAMRLTTYCAQARRQRGSVVSDREAVEWGDYARARTHVRTGTVRARARACRGGERTEAKPVNQSAKEGSVRAAAERHLVARVTVNDQGRLSLRTLTNDAHRLQVRR